ncbi:hypothetical protein CBM2587_B60085 [Cupriavidus taiwanensis]|uniref:Uncharacterized protein n=1 Tax=Cupriavidus taiwanensis TaxID=164546 RepID=A0A375C585_9BURK|nr:hypothetical protein CBM2587_B60085 [Cupriavidus taiwanensis]
MLHCRMTVPRDMAYKDATGFRVDGDRPTDTPARRNARPGLLSIPHRLAGSAGHAT